MPRPAYLIERCVVLLPPVLLPPRQSAPPQQDKCGGRRMLRKQCKRQQNDNSAPLAMSSSGPPLAPGGVHGSARQCPAGTGGVGSAGQGNLDLVHGWEGGDIKRDVETSNGTNPV